MTTEYKEPGPVLDHDNPFESMMQRFDKLQRSFSWKKVSMNI
jgi:hypothetical protein